MSGNGLSRRPAGTPESLLHAPDDRFLHEVIRTVASSLEVERVLAAIVDLLSEAARAHACYVFLADERGRMVLRACSAPYDRYVGRTVMERGEGLAGWVAQHREPVFIAQDATSDPRMKVFEELEEEKYQSLVSVPLVARNGSVLGVVALHAEAPHEYSAADADFLLTSASLVAGAIENAQLHAESERRVAELERLHRVSEAIAAAERLEDLLPTVCTRLVPLLRAAACELYLLEPDGERLRLRASAPPVAGGRVIGLQDVGAALAVSRTRARDRVDWLARTVVSGDGTDEPVLHVPLLVSGELLGLLVVRGATGHRFLAEDRDLAAGVVSQAAVAVKKIQLVERLSERNLIKDFFDDLADPGRALSAEPRGRRLRCDLATPRLVVSASLLDAATAADGDPLGAFEAKLAAVFRGALVERSDTRVRAIVPCSAGEVEARERLAAAQREAAPTAVVGVSSVCVGAAAYPVGFAEARQAEHGAAVVSGRPGVLAYEELGPYKYLLRLAVEAGARDRHRDRLRPLLEYDRAHRSQLFHTLEEYLQQRGRVASTAAKLYVHPNTLRQRLARIASITGLDLDDEDSLTVEMAMKLLRLEEALAARGD